MKRFSVVIRWRSQTMGVFSWRLDALAKNSAALVHGLLEHFGPRASISVKAIAR